MAKRAYIKHITSYYPNNFEFNNPENRITSKIGVLRRPVALPNECASDLAVEAAKIMFAKYNVNKEDIDALIPKVEMLRDITMRICEEKIKVYGNTDWPEINYIAI